jgi:hypothetical protein
LTPNYLGVRIQNVNEVVARQLKARKMTAYALAKAAREAGGTMTEQTVRNFLAGGNIKSNHLMTLLAVLGLEIRPKE